MRKKIYVQQVGWVTAHLKNLSSFLQGQITLIPSGQIVPMPSGKELGDVLEEFKLTSKDSLEFFIYGRKFIAKTDYNPVPKGGATITTYEAKSNLSDYPKETLTEIPKKITIDEFGNITIDGNNHDHFPVAYFDIIGNYMFPIQ